MIVKTIITLVVAFIEHTSQYIFFKIIIKLKFSLYMNEKVVLQIWSNFIQIIYQMDCKNFSTQFTQISK